MLKSEYFNRLNNLKLSWLGIALDGHPISIQTLVNILQGARELLRAVDDLESNLLAQREIEEIRPEILEIHISSLELIISPQQYYKNLEYAHSVFTVAYEIIQGIYEECLVKNEEADQRYPEPNKFLQKITQQAMEIDASQNSNIGTRIFNGIATFFRVGPEVKQLQVGARSFNTFLTIASKQAQRISKQAKAQALEMVLKPLTLKSPIFTFEELKGGPVDLASEHDRYLLESQ